MIDAETNQVIGHHLDWRTKPAKQVAQVITVWFYVQHPPLSFARSWWRAGPFGQFLGIEARSGSTFEILKLDARGRDNGGPKEKQMEAVGKGQGGESHDMNVDIDLI